ncbi:MAG: 3-dehydroquinate synthase [Planctomycetota bacterium]
MANSKMNSPMETVTVQLAERSYPIHIGADLLPQTGNAIAEVLPKTTHVVLMFDAAVENLVTSVRDSIRALDWRFTELPIPSGEASKSIQHAEQLWNQMLAEHTDRKSVVVALGGGVVGDLAGFMAATFARGLDLVQIPTTLLSQVDSSVGGKTGINLPGAKNIVGAFWQPRLVIIDSQSLNSLPQREFISGLAEVAKYGVILLPELFSYLEQNADAIKNKEPSALKHIVSESCKAKAHVVKEDERETTGLRAILNYGHTFAHAIESVAGYGTYLHGEAVSIGMHMAAKLAQQLGRVDADFVERQAKLLTALDLPISYPNADPAAMWEVMQHDKKVENGKLRFILPSRLGHVELVPGVSAEQAQAAIKS